MMRSLIVTADDFGLTEGINEGIVKARREGIVTFVNFLASGEAFDNAAGLKDELNINEMGAHLALTETVPVSDPATIPSLIAKNGRFFRHYTTFFARLFLGMVDPDHIRLELKSQMDRLKRLGIPVTNLSSHEHIHMAPAILKIFIELAGEYNIPSIRYLNEDRPMRRFALKKFYKALLLPYLNKRIKPALEKKQIVFTDHLLGFLDSGKIEEEILMDMLGSMDDGYTELVTHPGFLGPEILDRYKFHINCESELYALTSPRVKKTISEKNVALVTYSSIPH